MKKVVNLIVLMCLIFTLVTFFESIMQLMMGQKSDLNVHILNHLSYSFIGALSITLVKYANRKKFVLNILIPYIVNVPLMLLSIYITSLYMSMPDTAYRDAMFVFTVAFIIIGLIIEWKKIIFVSIVNRNNKMKQPLNHYLLCCNSFEYFIHLKYNFIKCDFSNNNSNREFVF